MLSMHTERAAQIDVRSHLVNRTERRFGDQLGRSRAHWKGRAMDGQEPIVDRCLVWGIGRLTG